MVDVHVILWWHHHQPWYLDPRTGHARLPWVRLHACRGYLDMAAAAEHPSADKVPHTFNMVPSLLDQLEKYANPAHMDRWLSLCVIPPAALTAEERAELTERMGHAGPTPVIALPRLDALKARVASGGSLTPQELLDLSVLATLAYCGATLCARDGVVRTLCNKGRDFTLAERDALMAHTRAVCGEVLQRYRALWAKGRIEITATPYFHPILPLVLDSDSMGEALPNNPRPPRFAFAQDAQWHVVKALERVETTLGKRPNGMWPAEGSVSEAAVRLLAESGVSFAATDEMVVRRSQSADATELDHGQPWLDPSGKVALFFRDHGVSDLIGFSYRFQPAVEAAADLVKRAREFGKARKHQGRPPVMAVILDGENPWEHYTNAGMDFLLALQGALSRARDVHVVTPSQHLAAHPATARLSRLHAGSWIDGTFAIWIGHAEDRQAWRLLGDARRAVERARAEGRSAAQVERAMECLMPAQGSDWFWWFGEEFQAREAGMYDALFRDQIRMAYEALGVTPPPALDEPIKNVHKRVKAARGWPVEPELSGGEPNPLQWSGAVHVTGRGSGAMAGAAGAVEEVLWGATVEALWLCVRFHGGVVHPGVLTVQRAGVAQRTLTITTPEGRSHGARTAVGRTVMVCWPLKDAAVHHGESVSMHVTFTAADGAVQRIPDAGETHVDVPEAYEQWRAAWA